MYKDLPEKLQERIKKCLMANDFPRAKALHDAWLAEHRDLTAQRSRRRRGRVSS